MVQNCAVQESGSDVVVTRPTNQKLRVAPSLLVSSS